MIVRILGEGQLDVPDGSLDELNVLDGALEQACEAGEHDAFAAAASRSTATTSAPPISCCPLQTRHWPRSARFSPRRD
jgi:hypothetical protein